MPGALAPLHNPFPCVMSRVLGFHRHSDGLDQFNAVVNAVQSSPELVRLGRDGRGEERLTSREMIAVEERLHHAAERMSEAAKIGPATVALFEAIMKAKPHPEQGFRSCLGIVGLARSYGVIRSNDIGATSYGSIASILKHGLDKAFATEPAPDAPPIRHGNIRGSGYFH